MVQCDKVSYKLGVNMSTITLQMSPQEFQRVITATVEKAIDRKLSEWLSRIENDGELRPEIGVQILRLRQERRDGKRGTPLAAVAEELGLDIAYGS